ncbi:MAG TPA: hypothetical protein VLK29_11670 [Luteimonas sp.]|nr:hypothetical protein [Luteimonas sp.]
MTTRAMGPGAGWDWLKQAVNLGSHRPMAIFGGAALVFGVVVVVALVLALLLGTAVSTLQAGGTGSMLASFAITIPVLMIMATLLVGYLRLLDAVENTRDASATDVFAGFSDWPTALRIFGFMLVMTLVQNLILGGLVAVLAPDVGAWYMQVLQNPAGTPAQVPTLPQGFGMVFAVFWVVGLFGYAVQAIGLGQIALAKRGVGGALVDGLSGAAKNLLPLLVLMLAMIAAAIVIGLVLLLLLFVVGLLAKVVGTWLLFVVGIPLYLAVVMAMIVVSFGVMYFMWRDVCAGTAGVRAIHDETRLEL